MPKVAPIQNSFSAGELSPLLNGRTDADRYKAGLAVCENYVPALQGPLIRRPGSRQVHEVRHSSKNQMLIPFKYSRDESYMIEYGTTDIIGVPGGDGKEYFRFFKDGALLTLGDKTISSISQASPGIFSVTTHGYATGDRVLVHSAGGMIELNNREFIVQTVTANTFYLLDSQTSATLNTVPTEVFLPYTGSGRVAKIYELEGTESHEPFDYDSFQFAQSNDILYVTGPQHFPFKLSRYGDVSWTYGAFPHSDGPYLALNNETTTLTSVHAAGVTTITASSVLGINNNLGFDSNDIGRPVKIRNGATWGDATITSVASSVSVEALVSHAFAASATASADWYLGAWRGDGAYPTGVTFHEGRLWFCGGINPQLIAGSYSDDYENFEMFDVSNTHTDDHGMVLIAASSEANATQWLAADEKGLIVGTAGGPWVIRPNSQGDILTPDTATLRKATNYGSSGVQPQQVDKATIYIQNSGRKVREFLYFYDVDGFRASDITILSEHITGEGLKDLAHQKEPQPLLWGLREDGVLVSMTYERDLENVKVGWAKHILGGYSNASQTLSPVVHSIAAKPNADGTEDELWMVTERYVNGRTRKDIEYFAAFFNDEMDQEDAFNVDCGLTYDSTIATAGVSGLNHLRGQIVSVLADGAPQSNRTVSSMGYVSLDGFSTKVHIGLPYTSKAKMLRLDVGAADGTAIGKTRRMHRMGMMFYNQGNLEIGMDFSNTELVEFRALNEDGSIALNTPVPLFTGLKTFELECPYDTENQFCWKQDSPLPGTVLAVMPQMVTQDR